MQVFLPGGGGRGVGNKVDDVEMVSDKNFFDYFCLKCYCF